MDVHHLLQLRPRVFWIWLQELETQNTFANGSDYICNSHPKCMITTSDTKTIEVFVVLTCSRQHWLVIVMLWLFYFKTNLDNLAPCSTNFTDRIFFAKTFTSIRTVCITLQKCSYGGVCGNEWFIADRCKLQNHLSSHLLLLLKVKLLRIVDANITSSLRC